MKKLLSLSIVAALFLSIFSSTAIAVTNKYSSWKRYTYKCPGCYKAAAIDIKVRIKYEKVGWFPPKYTFKLYGKMRNVPGYSNPHVFNQSGRLLKNGASYFMSPTAAVKYVKANGSRYVTHETAWIYLGYVKRLKAYSWDTLYGRNYVTWSYGNKWNTAITRGQSKRIW